MDLETLVTGRFKKAVASLLRALTFPPLIDHAEQDTALLRFELAAELMPKALKRALDVHGVKESLPKDIVRAAREAQLVTPDKAEVLIKIIDARNRMVHDYSEGYAARLFVDVRTTYAPALRELAEQW
jgi:nucleotidyltransferase substrate binding protein (TIGR01987 family)